MTITGVRFRPPAVTLTPEVRWALLRAFGPLERPWKEGPIDGATVLDVARRLSLSPRLGSRVPLGQLEAEAGPEAALGLVENYRATAARAAQLVGLEHIVAKAAREVGAPIVLLKYAAISRLARLALGARGVSDLDVLVPVGQIGALRDALVREGFTQGDFRDEPQHVPPLHHPSGAVLEIHRCIPGVRVLPHSGDARAEDLLATGLAEQAYGLPAGCYLPGRDLVLAHTLVHGIDQHGMAPTSYPLMRMVADLIDLGCGRAGLPRALALTTRWIGHRVTEEELRATSTLCDALAAGRLPTRDNGPDADARLLLEHIVAGSLDAEYQRSLRLRSMWTAVGSGPPAARIRALWNAVFLTRGQIDMIYGTPRSALGYLGLRLWRPFDLLRRATRYGVSAVRLKLARQREDGR